MDVRPARTSPWRGRGGGVHIVLEVAFMLSSFALHQVYNVHPRREEQDDEHERARSGGARRLRDILGASVNVGCEHVTHPHDCQWNMSRGTACSQLLRTEVLCSP